MPGGARKLEEKKKTSPGLGLSVGLCRMFPSGQALAAWLCPALFIMVLRAGMARSPGFWKALGEGRHGWNSGGNWGSEAASKMACKTGLPFGEFGF